MTANRRDETLDATGSVIHYVQWPADPSGQVDDNGTLRALTAEEIAEWAAAADESDRETDTAALKDDLQNAKNVRDAAVQSRTDMDHETPDPAALAKWAPENETDRGPVSRTGNQSNQITAIQDQLDLLSADIAAVARLANDLRIDNRRQYGDTRLIAAMLVRKFRKDRDDE